MAALERDRSYIMLLDTASTTEDIDESRRPKSKNPLKRLTSKIVQEVNEIKHFNSLSLEEIRAINAVRMEEHMKRQEKKAERLEKRYGSFGKVIAASSRGQKCGNCVGTVGL